MRGVDYSNTSYRRLYRPTAAFKLLGCEAQCVYWALRQVLDPAGYFPLHGAKASEALAVELGWTLDDLDFIERGLERLLEREWIFYREKEDALHEPDFYAAEHASKSGKLRTRECRKRKQALESPTAPQAQKPRPVPSSSKPDTMPEKPPAPVAAPRPLRAVATFEGEQPAKRKKRPIGFQQADAGEDVTPSAEGESQVAVPEMPPHDVHQPETYGFELVEQPSHSGVTNCYSPVTDRYAGVTNSPSQYPVPNTPIPKAAASESVSACARASPPGTAERPRGERLAADRAFQDFAHQVETSFGRATSSTRLLNSGEAQLVREWFESSIDPGLIGETLLEKARVASRPVRSLLYFREPVREAWARHRELVACSPPDALPPPALDFARCLDGLVAAIPLGVPDRESLVEEIGSLRGQARADPQGVEDRLREIERRYLGRLDLDPDQTRKLEQALAFLGRTLPAGSLPEHRKRISNQLKREQLGLPALTLSADPTRNPPSRRGIRKELSPCDLSLT